jgi:hypothetical protein
MVKGHNKNKPVSQSKQKGGDEHLKGKKVNKVSNERKGRASNDDQSRGTKGKNSI